MFFDVRTALADNDLRKVGRACDLAGIEVAFPMLDEDLIEFAAKIPSSLLIRGLELRYFFRKAMEGFLPQKTLRKEKHGFAMPFWQWARKDDGIAEIVDSCFEGLRSRRVFRKEFLDRVLREHRSEDETQFDSIIYDLIMLELWQRNREAA
jgi:asparagine synthase (glutamine-hydrolysing)